MKKTTFALALAASLCGLSTGCKKESAPAPTSPKAPPGSAPASEKPAGDTPAEKKVEPAAPVEGVAPANAEGGAVGPATKASNCPASLSGTDEVDRTIPADCGTIPVTDNYQFNGSTLTIEGGNTLAFARATGISVGEYKPSKLVVKGTKDKPVTFTTSGDKVAGEWRGVVLGPNADRSSVEGLVVEWAGNDDNTSVAINDALDVVLKGITIKNAKTSGLTITGDSTVEVTGSTFDAIGTVAIRSTLRASGGIGTDNVFPKDATGVVQIDGGSHDKALIWKSIGTPWVVLGGLTFDSPEGASVEWKIEAGNQIKFDGDAGIAVGQWQPSSFTVSGTKDKPVTFEPRDATDAGAWPGLTVGSNGTAVIDGAVISGVLGDGTYAVTTNESGKLTIKNTTFKKDKVGVYVAGGAVVKGFESNTFEGVSPAIKGYIALLGSLGAGNVYGDGGRILIEGGSVDVEGPVTWKTQAAVIDFADNVGVDTTLNVEAGARFRFGDGHGFRIGEWKSAKFFAKGTAEAPITAVGVEAKAGVWAGLTVLEKGVVELTNVAFSDTGDTGAVFVNDGATAKLDHVSAARSVGATLGWACTAKVEKVEVTASEGTPAAEKAPEGCQ